MEEDIKENVNTSGVLRSFLTFRTRVRTSCILWHPESYQIFSLHMPRLYLFVLAWTCRNACTVKLEKGNESGNTQLNCPLYFTVSNQFVVKKNIDYYWWKKKPNNLPFPNSQIYSWPKKQFKLVYTHYLSNAVNSHGPCTLQRASQFKAQILK